MTSSRATSATTGAGRAAAARAPDRRRSCISRPSRTSIARSTGPDAFIRDQRGRHPRAAQGGAQRLAADAGSTTRHRFHHVSTDEVYGSLGPTIRAFTETTPYAPNSPYAASKAASDHLVRAYHHTYGLPVTTTNCSNNYGPYQFPEKLIPLMIVNALEGKPLPVYGDGAQRARLAVRGGPLPGASSWCSIEGRRGRDVQRRRGRNERRNIDVIHSLCGLLDAAFVGNPDLRLRFPQSPAASGDPPAS